MRTHFLLVLIAAVVLLAACAPAAAPAASQMPLATEMPAATEAAATVAELPVATELPAATEMPEAAEAATTVVESPVANPRTFRIVPEASQAAYEVTEDFLAGAVGQLGKALGLFNPIGRTNAVSGEFTVAPGAPPQLQSGAFQVDISTLQSDDSRRDRRIRERWLESARFPIATFTATAAAALPEAVVEGEPVSFKLAGDMTIREATQPVTFDVEATLQGDTLSGTARTNFLMSDFGVDPPSIPGLLTVMDPVTVTVTFEAKEAPAAQ